MTRNSAVTVLLVVLQGCSPGDDMSERITSTRQGAPGSSTDPTTTQLPAASTGPCIHPEVDTTILSEGSLSSTETPGRSTQSTTEPVLPSGDNAPKTPVADTGPEYQDEESLDSVRSDLSSVMSTRSSVASFTTRGLHVEAETDELPLGFSPIPVVTAVSVVPNVLGTVYNAQVIGVDFAAAAEYQLIITKLMYPKGPSKCTIIPGVQLPLAETDNLYVLEKLEASPVRQTWKGVATESSGKLHKISVKIGGVNQLGMYKEIAALTVLRGMRIAPRILNLPSGHPCVGRALASTYHGYRQLGDLWVGKVTLSPAELASIALRGLTMLETMHNRGIVHGNVNLETFVYRPGPIERVIDTLRLVDFEFSKLWVDVDGKRPFRVSEMLPDSELLPVTSWSVFTLEKSVTRRSTRDDLIGLIESVVQLGTSGPLSFELPIEGEALTGMDVAKAKVHFGQTSATYAHPSIYSVYRRVFSLSFGVRPDYAEYAEILTKIIPAIQ